MLVQLKERKIKCYPLDKGFWIDIQTGCKTYEAWLYHDRIGIKSMMFGLNKKDVTYEQFLEIVENNVYDYIDYYMYDYMERMDPLS